MGFAGYAAPHNRVAALQVFIDSRYKNVDGGRALTNDEVTGLLIAALFAGQHTSSITSAWTGLLMMANEVILVGKFLLTVLHASTLGLKGSGPADQTGLKH